MIIVREVAPGTFCIEHDGPDGYAWEVQGRFAALYWNEALPECATDLPNLNSAIQAIVGSPR